MEIEWCADPPDYYDPSTRFIRLDGVSVLHLFTTTNTDAWQHPECDYQWEISKGWIPLTKASQNLSAQVWGFNGWAGGESVIFQRPTPWTSITIAAERSLLEPGALQAASLNIEVTNNSAVTDTVLLNSPSCSGAATGCSLSVSTVGLAAGASDTVTLGFTGSAAVGDSGRITLTARSKLDGATTSSTFADVVIVPPAPAPPPALSAPYVELTTPVPHERGLCIAIAAGEGAAYECGDLRLTHALPAVVTQGTAKAPTLIYSTQSASPSPIVRARVTVPAGTLPDSVTAEARVNGVLLGRGSWSGSEWDTGGSSSRIRSIAVALDGSGLATGYHEYTFTTTAHWSGSGSAATSDSGYVGIVNRSLSPYGAGWWIAGIETLVPVTLSGVQHLAWIGGDGSTRLYAPDTASGSGWYRAEKLLRPERIQENGDGSFTRFAAGGVRVFFSSSGLHDSTSNRLGQVTRFIRSGGGGGGGGITSIQLPRLAGGSLDYTLTYGNPNGILSSVAVSGGSGPSASRVTTIATSGRSITGITDPDTLAVTFGLGSGVHATRVVSRTNKRSDTTTFSFDSTSRFTSHTIDAGVSGLISTAHWPAEIRGVAGSHAPAAQPLDSIFTLLDGPRSDVADITRIHVNDYGAPTRVRTPVGGETRLAYDSNWPALVRASVDAAGLLSEAWIDATRGLTDSTSIRSPNGTSGIYGAVGNSVTRYEWHPATDLVTGITGADSVVSEFSWDTTTRNLLWRESGGSNRRINFAYDSLTGLLESITPPLESASHLVYDDLGNVRFHISPLGDTTSMVRDSIGRAVLVAEPDGRLTRSWYGMHDLVDSTRTVGEAVSVPGWSAPADSFTVVYQYNETGHPVHVSRRYRSNGFPTTIQTSTGYDAADRVVWHMPIGVGREDYGLDAAGNVVWRRNAADDTVHMAYDAANRLVERIVPGRTYSTAVCWAYDFAMDISPYPGCNYTFPTRPWGSTGGVVIEADTARYAHDARGHVTRAWNGSARVRRTYTPAGLVATDSLRTRTYRQVGLSEGFTEHRYGIGYEYDLALRRSALVQPGTLRPSGYSSTKINYGYSTATGELTSVTDLFGRSFTLDYDDAGRHWRTVFPSTGGASERRDFDAAGRVSGYTAPGVDSVVYTRDPAGRVTAATDGLATDVDIWYNGLGGVVQTTGLSVTSLGIGVTERLALDALGNRERQRALYAKPAGPDENQPRRLEYDLGRLVAVHYDSTGCTGPSCSYPYEARYAYDVDGNQVSAWSYDLEGGTFRMEHALSYYDAENRLRVVNRHVGPGGSPVSGSGGVYEEYRYDAFGRRVFVRSRSTASCGTTPCADSYAERIVWDGEQLLAEIRAPGDSASAASSAIESDGPSYPSLLGGYPFGRVTYVHGVGIDAPLAVTREGLAGTSGGLSVYPHGNWRGEYTDGSVPGQTVPHSNCLGHADCKPISWPGRHLTLDGAPVPGTPAPVSWWGSLLARKTDGSGLQYMRNRYYDPQTGRFTQLDPIGLAGGVNQYGFAAGDPLNHRDPFGLRAQSDTTQAASDSPRAVDRCEVAEILRGYAEELSSKPWIFVTLNYPSDFDFKYRNEVYEVEDQWLRADEFGNFAAGYAATYAFDLFGKAGMNVGGILTASRGDEHWTDYTSWPMINAGYQRVRLEMANNGARSANRTYGMHRRPYIQPLTSTAGCG